MKEFNLIIKQRSEISIVENILHKINKEFLLGEEKFVNLLIAVTEAVINAVIHGNKNNPEKKVNLNLKYDDKEITVKIKDEGEGFDPKNIPDPTSDENLFKESGRGIYIIRSLVDKFDFKSDKSGSELILTMYKQ
ncbi:MAG TPA: ATP-binding protein [Ignavibacteria bacterium]